MYFYCTITSERKWILIQPSKNKLICFGIYFKQNIPVYLERSRSEKTVIALKITADKKQPALIIAHRKQLLEQWIERIESFLKIPKNEIGKIGQGKKNQQTDY